MTRLPSNADLSPLDQIRQTEAEVNRSIAAARQSAEQTIAAAEQQALEIKRQAREVGLSEGQARHWALMASANEEFGTIVAEAQARSQELERRGRQSMDILVQRAIQVVLGMSAEGIDQ